MRISFRTIVRWTGEVDSKSRRMRKARLNATRRAAAYVWRVARNSIREGRRRERHSYIDPQGRPAVVERWVPSQPGKPPLQHGSHWKSSFRFAVDEASLAAYIGPIGGRNGIAPIHEYGTTGVVRWTTWRWTGRGTGVSEQHEKVISFPRRPTMGPALDRSRSRIAQFWSGCVS